MAVDLREGSQVFATKDRIQVYSQPFRDSDRLSKATENKNTYREWKIGDLIGIATGRMAVLGDSPLDQFVEVKVQLGVWRKKEISILWYGIRKITVDWFREDLIGYVCVGEESFGSYIDKPITPNDIDNNPNSKPPATTTPSYETYFVIGAIFVVVIALALAYKANRI